MALWELTSSSSCKVFGRKRGGFKWFLFSCLYKYKWELHIYRFSVFPASAKALGSLQVVHYKWVVLASAYSRSSRNFLVPWNPLHLYRIFKLHLYKIYLARPCFLNNDHNSLKLLMGTSLLNSAATWKQLIYKHHYSCDKYSLAFVTN